jgi:hypothetical protein
LAEAQPWGLNPRDNHEELTELVELRRRLKEDGVERIAETGQLAILVGDISMVLVDLACLPSEGSPRTCAWLATS